MSKSLSEVHSLGKPVFLSLPRPRNVSLRRAEEGGRHGPRQARAGRGDPFRSRSVGDSGDSRRELAAWSFRRPGCQASRPLQNGSGRPGVLCLSGARRSPARRVKADPERSQRFPVSSRMTTMRTISPSVPLGQYPQPRLYGQDGIAPSRSTIRTIRRISPIEPPCATAAAPASCVCGNRAKPEGYTLVIKAPVE